MKKWTPHGESRARLYGIWSGMKTRCYCPTRPSFAYYGGRGVTVCDEWRESYVAFRDWANSNGYKDHLELDRRDPAGNYDPGNCRWATRSQQMRNTRKRRDAKTSRCKGVSKHSQNGNWVAQGHRNGRPAHIGVFSSELDAARAYDEWASKNYGEFSLLNFKEGEKC